MKFIKYHWFGLIISIFLGLFLLQFIIVLISPHHDAQGRGFTKCTQSMAEQIELCGSQKWCVFKTVVKNTACDSGVIFFGIKQWVNGAQPRPWSNYLFIPTTNTEDRSDLHEFYQDNPDVVAQMTELKQKNTQLEKTLDEQQNTAGMESD